MPKDALDTAIARVIRYRQDPVLYCREVLDVRQIWQLQAELLAACPVAVRDHKHIYLASGHSLGKDYITAAISLWFLQTNIPSIVIQTAPTDRQTKSIMWKETMGHWGRKKVDFGGRAYVEPRLEVQPDWYMIGFTTKETGATMQGGGGRFQGFHSPNMCIIATEAQAIEDEIYDQIDGIATSENCLVIYIGNPTRATGRFAKGLRDKVNNIVFNFSCLDSPNYQQGKTVIPGLVSREWVEDKRRKWGEHDPRWIGRVLGQIPDIGINSIFPLSLIDHMTDRHGLLSINSLVRGVSVDPAGEGVDDNVFMSGAGGEVLDVFTQSIMPPSVKAIKAIEMCKDIKGHFVIVDCDGLGIETYSELNKLSTDYRKNINIIKFHGSAPSEVKMGAGKEEKQIYANKRAEAAFVAKERGQTGKAAINPKDTELIEDLTEDEYFEDNKGRLQVIPKDEIKERLGRSPGRGDCWKMLQWAFEHQTEDMIYRNADEETECADAVRADELKEYANA